mmetsp:Transcript_1994/g.4978  ORF Transcript_1994/g.4978 Transcript_1994/m.4978 type:complete len:231 (+) Transcript_1994:520-1212(+)
MAAVQCTTERDQQLGREVDCKLSILVNPALRVHLLEARGGELHRLSVLIVGANQQPCSLSSSSQRCNGLLALDASISCASNRDGSVPRSTQACPSRRSNCTLPGAAETQQPVGARDHAVGELFTERHACPDSGSCGAHGINLGACYRDQAKVVADIRAKAEVRRNVPHQQRAQGVCSAQVRAKRQPHRRLRDEGDLKEICCAVKEMTGQPAYAVTSAETRAHVAWSKMPS